MLPLRARPASCIERLQRTAKGAGETIDAAIDRWKIEQHAEDGHRRKCNADRSGEEWHDAAVGKDQAAPQALVEEATKDQSQDKRCHLVALAAQEERAD